MSRVRALVGACHPLPSLAVTGFAAAVSASAGRSGTGVVLVAAAVLAGQLSIGWSNDLVDRARDVEAGRTDKPLATGGVDPRTVSIATAVAAVVCVPLSLASGVAAGVAHLAGVGGGWSYNLGLKRTWVSPLPYAVSFALLTSFVTLGLDGAPWPRPWALGAAALLGVGAHFLNVVPDVAADRAAGVRGLPQRLGGRASAVLGAVLLAVAATLVALGPGTPIPWWALAGGALAVLAAAAAAVTGLAAARSAAGRPGATSAPFLLAVGTAAVTIALVVARGGALVR